MKPLEEIIMLQSRPSDGRFADSKMQHYLTAVISAPGKLGRSLVDNVQKEVSPLLFTSFAMAGDYFMNVNFGGKPDIFRDASVGFGMYSGMALGLVKKNYDSDKVVAGLLYGLVSLAPACVNLIAKDGYTPSNMAADCISPIGLFSVSMVGGIFLDYLSLIFDSSLEKIKMNSKRSSNADNRKPKRGRR